MREPPRIPISDLVAEYSLHPERRHVYVEGPCDKLVVEWLLHELHIEGVRVYDVDEIEVPNAEINSQNLPDNRKSRLLLLARKLRELYDAEIQRVLCVVDADYDYLFDSTEDNPYLIYTDGASFEMYFYADQIVNHVLRFGLGCLANPPRNIIGQLEPILLDVFAIRAANESLGMGLRWIPFESKCAFKPDGSFCFDRDKFIRAYLSKGSVLHRYEEFLACVHEYRNAEHLDIRRRIRGHDFVSLLARYCQERTNWKPGKASGESLMSAILRLTISVELLLKEPLFARLRSAYE